jgi:hypothetical protein
VVTTALLTVLRRLGRRAYDRGCERTSGPHAYGRGRGRTSAHAARKAARRRGRGASVGEMCQEAGLRVVRGLGQRGVGKARGVRMPRVGRRVAGDARRTGARCRGVLAPGLKQFAEPHFEFKLLLKFE